MYGHWWISGEVRGAVIDGCGVSYGAGAVSCDGSGDRMRTRWPAKLGLFECDVKERSVVERLVGELTLDGGRMRNCEWRGDGLCLERYRKRNGCEKHMGRMATKW